MGESTPTEIRGGARGVRGVHVGEAHQLRSEVGHVGYVRHTWEKHTN